MARGLFALATEDMEVDDTTVTDVVALNDEVNDISEISDGISEASAATDEITEIQDVAQKSIESGEGLPEAAVEMMMISLKSINRRLGIQGDKTVFAVPATENFGTTKSRLAATNAVLEEAEKGKAGVGTKIAAFFKKLYERFMDFINRLFDMDGKLVKSLPAKVEGSEASTIKDMLKAFANDVMEFETRVTKITTEEYDGRAAKLIERLADAKEDAKKLMEEFKAVINYTVDDIETAKADIKEKEAAFNAYLTENKGFKIDAADLTLIKTTVTTLHTQNKTLRELRTKSGFFKAVDAVIKASGKDSTQEKRDETKHTVVNYAASAYFKHLTTIAYVNSGIMRTLAKAAKQPAPTKA